MRRASWFSLNADGVFIACLVILLGVAGLLDHARLIDDYGYFPGSAYVWLTMYVVAGVGLLLALWTRRPDWEAYSRATLIAANVLSLVREASVVGVAGIRLEIILAVFLMATMGMRLYALLRGGEFALVPWTRKR